MERIDDRHLEEIKRFLEESRGELGKLVPLVRKHYEWESLPELKKASVYAVDGSRMAKRLSGAIIYAVSASAVGNDLYYWNDIGALFPYSNADDRIRVHMDTLEKRMGAMIAEKADLVLMDGTISGALIRPPSYANSTTQKLYSTHGRNLLEASLDFLDALNIKWKEWRRELRKGVISGPSLLARGREGKSIFQILMEKGSKSLKRNLWWVGDTENLIVLFEYLEYLHALDRLLDGEIASIAKTFYRSDVIQTVAERERLKKVPIMVDTPVVASLTGKSGYLRFSYRKGPKDRLAKLILDLMEHGMFPNLREILVLDEKNNIVDARIRPAYIRFADGGLIYLLEVPEKQDFEETLAKLLSVAEDEYVIPLEYAHHSVVIKKREFDAYVDAILSAIVGEDESYLNFLRYGREPLE
ncbi:DNA double-strand break repair nuclease NurA [Thermococcus sp. MV11]|uniref:DNA double-strand break repair nuclease NurA n=1 Tax=Thermococcus sp. MV11 TaxID=1638267 RepID=UPI001431E6B7|nr:DNA double-strand break repair nuclease NurA [Thermococcus sp. MV11]NJE02740.1 5'-3' exonuclease [Thermococcus sp. MV11]